MADRLVLNAEPREKTGTKHTARLRETGRLPAVVYGHKKEPKAISFDLSEFIDGIHHGCRLFDVTIGGDTQPLLVKELQYDYLCKDIIHVDFVRVDLSEKVKVNVPVDIRGTARGAHEGGVVDQLLNKIEIECTVTEIPDCIVVNIKELGLGDSIRAGQVALPEGVKLVTDPQVMVLSCHLVAEPETAEKVEEETPIAPEVITERAVKEEEVEKSE